MTRIGIALLLLGIGAQAGFALAHVDGAGIGAALVTAGIALLTGFRAHATERQLTELRRSLRPPPQPSDR